MAHMTNYLESKVGEHSLGVDAWTHPATVYLALFTSNPGEEGSQTDEVSGGGYQRQPITFEEDETEAGQFTNFSLQFNDMPEVDVSALGIMDAQTGGNMLYYRDFSTVSVDAGNTYFVAEDAITINFD